MLRQHAPCHLAAYLLHRYTNKGLVPTYLQQYRKLKNQHRKLLKQMK